MNPFQVNYENLDEVIAFAKKVHRKPYTTYVVKCPDRDNYNITMQKPGKEVSILWRSE